MDPIRFPICHGKCYAYLERDYNAVAVTVTIVVEHSHVLALPDADAEALFIANTLRAALTNRDPYVSS